jgi:hypothetical protein
LRRKDLRAARANLVSGADKRHPRRKRGFGKKQKGLGRVLYEILDQARMVSSSVPDRGSARTGNRPRNVAGEI